jgi:hypothetical protein
MATERLAMHQLKEILRQKLVLRRSHREVAKAVGVSLGLVSGVMSRAAVLEIVAEHIEELDEAELEERFYGRRAAKRASRPLPDPAEMHVELKRAGVTLQLLHLEYLERHPEGYRYTTYCDAYRSGSRSARRRCVKIRNQVFHTLGELNARIRELVIELNARIMRLYKVSRTELFNRIEKNALSALPADAFEYAVWKKAKLNVDYHRVEIRRGHPMIARLEFKV